MIIIQYLIQQNTVSLIYEQCLGICCPIQICVESHDSHNGITYICYVYFHFYLAVSIEENTIPTEPLITVTATDTDSEVRGFGTVMYSIEEADGSFIINNMGQIFVNKSLDREAT